MKKSLLAIILDLVKSLLAFWRAKKTEAAQNAKVETGLREQANVDTHRPVSTDVDDILGRLSAERKPGDGGHGAGDTGKRNPNDR